MDCPDLVLISENVGLRGQSPGRSAYGTLWDVRPRPVQKLNPQRHVPRNPELTDEDLDNALTNSALEGKTVSDYLNQLIRFRQNMMRLGA